MAEIPVFRTQLKSDPVQCRQARSCAVNADAANCAMCMQTLAVSKWFFGSPPSHHPNAHMFDGTWNLKSVSTPAQHLSRSRRSNPFIRWSFGAFFLFLLAFLLFNSSCLPPPFLRLLYCSFPVICRARACWGSRERRPRRASQGQGRPLRGLM